MTSAIAKAEQQQARPIPASASGHRAYPILYVDDEPQNLFTFRYALEDQFTVLTARNGREAMQLLEREQIAVLMCDQRMPEMTGVEICRKAREMRPDVIRIIVTAYADMQVAIDAINQGQVLRYLTKPWRNDELVDVLESAIDLVRMRRTVHEMQARMLRGGHPPVFEAMLRQVASELQSPVGALEMGAEHLGDLLEAGLLSWESTERAKQLVEHAKESQRGALRPLNQLRAITDKLSRGQRLAPLPESTSCDAARVARATARILSTVLDPNIRFQLVLNGAPTVRMDPGELGQALVHLVMNSSQALASAHTDQACITLHVSEVPSGAEIVVSDSGPGLTGEQLERVFDPYYTTREGSADLGLAVVKHLVSQAGGTVWAEDRAGQGTRFVIRLPALG